MLSTLPAVLSAAVFWLHPVDLFLTCFWLVDMLPASTAPRTIWSGPQDVERTLHFKSSQQHKAKKIKALLVRGNAHYHLSASLYYNFPPLFFTLIICSLQGFQSCNCVLIHTQMVISLFLECQSELPAPLAGLLYSFLCPHTHRHFHIIVPNHLSW